MSNFFSFFEKPDYKGLDYRAISSIEENKSQRRALLFIPTSIILFMYVLLSTISSGDIKKNRISNYCYHGML